MIGSNALIGLVGDPSDCQALYDELYGENKQHEMNFNGRSLSCSQIASKCRSLIIEKLRDPRQRYQVLTIVAGWDHIKDQPCIYWLDNIGSMKKVPYAAHGDEFTFILSLLDQQKRLNSKSIKSMSIQKEDFNINANTNTNTNANTKSLSGSKTIERMVSVVAQTQGCTDPLVPTDSPSSDPKEGEEFVRTVWEIVRKRSLGSITKYRLKSITSKGLTDHGLYSIAGMYVCL